MADALAISVARWQLGALVDRAHLSHEPIFISRRGRRVVAIVNADDYERLLELAEDAADAEAALTARQKLERTAALPVPWDVVKAELGRR